MSKTIKKETDTTTTSTIKARDAKEYDMLLIDFIESELKGESK